MDAVDRANRAEASDTISPVLSAGAHTHSISGSTASGGSHSHSLSGSTASGGSHSHTVSGSTATTGNSGTNANLPPYVAINYVIKT